MAGIGNELTLSSWLYYLLLFPLALGSRYFYRQGFYLSFLLNLIIIINAIAFYSSHGTIAKESTIFTLAFKKLIDIDIISKNPGLIWIIITYFVIGRLICDLSEESYQFKQTSSSTRTSEKRLKSELENIKLNNENLTKEIKKAADEMKMLRVSLTTRMESLKDITTRIVKSLNYDEIINQLIQASQSLLGAKKIAVYKEAENVHALELVEAIGYEKNKLKFIDKNAGIIGWVFQNKRILTIDEVNRNYNLSGLLKGNKISISICAPIFIENGKIGSILVLDDLAIGSEKAQIKTKGHKDSTPKKIVSEDAQRMISILIDMTSLALKNALFHEKSITMADQPFDKIEDLEVKKEKMYQIGKSYEENEMYKGAIEIYQEILKLDSNYRDVPKKLQKLRELRAVQKEYEENKIQFTDDMLKKYKNVSKIGIGGMGVVYRAQEIDKKRTVAIKVIAEKYRENQKTIQRFIKRDGMAAQRLDHPNIVKVFEVNTDKVPYIVMEFIEGDSFRKILDKMNKIPPHYVKKIAIQVGEALAYAHNNNIIHRDIKPDNIMLHRNKIIKLMDFGLAKITDVTAMTETGEVFGTLYYMPPEQLKGEQVSEATDLYSLGITLYEFLTGTLPFKGNNPEQIMYKIFNSTPAPPSSILETIPKQLDDIILKAIDKDINKRYQSAYEIIDAFKKIKLQNII